MHAKKQHKVLGEWVSSSVKKSSKPRSKNPVLFPNVTLQWGSLNWKGYRKFHNPMCALLSRKLKCVFILFCL